MQVSRSEAKHRLYDALLESGEQSGWGVTSDHNGYRQEGMHIAQASIHRGLRWSTSRAYVRPAVRRSNLHVLSKTYATRIVIDHGTAVGIEVADGPGVTRISARREVVLCAGAFGSPKLLMLSGIGPADELRRHGIPVVADVAQVGQNLQNHPGVDVQWAADHSDSLTAAIGVIGRARLAAEWGLLRRGLGATNFFEAGAFLRTNDQVAFPDMQYEFLALTRRLVNGRLVPVPGFQFWMDLSRPHSRGHGDAALGGSRGTAAHRVQPPLRPTRPDRPGRRHPADPRDRRPTGLDALQPGRAHARTGRHQRRRARGLRPPQARDVVPPLRHSPDGSATLRLRSTRRAGSAPSRGCGWSTRRSCRRSSRPTSTHQ